jgi:hypothetical protein
MMCVASAAVVVLIVQCIVVAVQWFQLRKMMESEDD